MRAIYGSELVQACQMSIDQCGINAAHCLTRLTNRTVFRYHKLKERDILKFGLSMREYVILHEPSEIVVKAATQS